jgi:hypothetical protein
LESEFHSRRGRVGLRACVCIIGCQDTSAECARSGPCTWVRAGVCLYMSLFLSASVSVCGCVWALVVAVVVAVALGVVVMSVCMRMRMPHGWE